MNQAMIKLITDCIGYLDILPIFTPDCEYEALNNYKVEILLLKSVAKNFFVKSIIDISGIWWKEAKQVISNFTSTLKNHQLEQYWNFSKAVMEALV